MDNLFTAGKLVKWASDALSEFKSEFFCPIYPHFISYPEIHMYSSLYIFKNPQLTFLEVAQRAGSGENPDFSCPELGSLAVQCAGSWAVLLLLLLYWRHLLESAGAPGSNTHR